MSKKPTYGPDNPHPLSQLQTELVWEGKYDEYGNRREVDIAGWAMPMQKMKCHLITNLFDAYSGWPIK
jgi:adenine-specific DNA-methyltransferase